MGSNTYVRADVWTVAQTDQGNVVLVRPRQSDMVVPIFIGQLETQAILIGLGRVEMPRPLTHDLLLSVLGAFGAEVSRVEIRDLRERTFYANIVVRSTDGETTIDARPSDALALAVRTKAEVFVAEDVVEAAGVPVDMIREAPEAGFDQTDMMPPDDVDLFAGMEPVSGLSGTKQGTGSADTVPGVSLPDTATPEVRAEIMRLRVELDAAVAAEDYERAARIRDRLHGLL